MSKNESKLWLYFIKMEKNLTNLNTIKLQLRTDIYKV